ncbi:MAG: hypothetical protein QOG08_1661 [Chloroflexota bacterium]|jgi:hypothetical protein|nr:hypothetical protein [Chloroflexota bacterium]
MDIDLAAPPSGTGCAECDASGGWWFHLRRCAACGHIGCCDSSPSQHASHHAAGSGHPIIQSFEPQEDWYWNYKTQQYLDGPQLMAPRHHPLDQPVPGPAGRVPRDWQRHLH